MANRKLRVLLKKIYSNGDIDTIFFRSRAKDVYVDDDGSTTLQDTVDKVNEMQDGATKVEESATNGNIKINGSETQVYKHPNSGATAGTYNKVTVNAEGHVTSGTNVTDWDGTVSGDISNATATFTQASTRENITTGSNVKTILGKIAKYFADLKSLAFVDKVGTANLDSTLTTAYNNRVTTDKVTTSTSINAAGWVADARAIATLQNQINTINSNLYPLFMGNSATISVTINSNEEKDYDLYPETYDGFIIFSFITVDIGERRGICITQLQIDNSNNKLIIGLYNASSVQVSQTLFVYISYVRNSVISYH